MDKKTQGRILEAIGKISRAPTVAAGDTVKALSGELKGCWRYRIDDYRLVYRPQYRFNRIVLLLFASRGSIYD
jgi:mRNA-degrading endonuclease RelE of RelBE toxin-antitoxin system